MNKSNLVLGLLCLIAVASLSGVAMTQENDFGTIEEPLANERPLLETLDERSVPEPLLEPDSNAAYQRRDHFSDPQGGSRPGGRADEPDLAPASSRLRREEEETMDQLLDDRFVRQPIAEQPRASVPRVMRPRQRSRTVIETFMEVVPPEEVVENRKLQAAIKSLKTSKTESEKKKAADIISAQLKLQFERDLKKREEELAKVEERVRSLREQLDKRKAAQDDIINLRLQTLVNDANGLGFPTNNFGGSSTSGAYFPEAVRMNQFAPRDFELVPSDHPIRDDDSGLFFDRTEALPRERARTDDFRPGTSR